MNCPLFLQHGPSWWFGKDSPIRSLLDSSASRRHASLVFFFFLLDAPLPQFFFIILQGMAGTNWCFQFLTSILDVFFWIPYPPGQWSRSLAIFVCYQDGAFSCDHFCFSFSLAFFPILSQSSGHRWSGLDVSCFLVNLHPDLTYPSGGFLPIE